MTTLPVRLDILYPWQTFCMNEYALPDAPIPSVWLGLKGDGSDSPHPVEEGNGHDVQAKEDCNSFAG